MMIDINKQENHAQNISTPEKDVLTVSQLSVQIKDILEHNFQIIKIKGEISNLVVASSGHIYFNIKDNNAVIAAICWRSNASRLSLKPENGLEVIIKGKITTYFGQSKYQLIVNNIIPTGVGSFMQILEERKERLRKAGIFDSEHKKSIPFFPSRIGVVTSLKGAVIQDILHRITARCPVHVMIWGVSVQGEGSASEVTNAVIGFNNLDSSIKPDVIIVARGGGSIEDLWSFNDEKLIMSIFESNIPVISAIGHETDYSLSDLVADVRAPTPTAAAEIATPVIEDLKNGLLFLSKTFYKDINNIIAAKQRQLSYMSNNIARIDNKLDFYAQKLDLLQIRLSQVMSRLVVNYADRLKYSTQDTSHVKQLIKTKELEYQYLYKNLRSNIDVLINNFAQRLQTAQSKLCYLDHKNILKLGYSIVENSQGEYITSINSTNRDDEVKIKLYDGSLNAKILDS